MRRDSKLSLSLGVIKPNIDDNEISFKTTSVTLLSTSVNNETNTKNIPWVAVFLYLLRKNKGFSHNL